MEISMIILAGGRNSRMGTDKAALLYQGKTFLDIQKEKAAELGISEVIISGNFGLPDRFPGKGPLGGLETCLRAASGEWALVLPVDAPLAPPEELKKLVDFALHCGEKAAYLQCGQEEHPLIGVYHTSLADAMVEEFTQRKGSVFAFLRRVGCAVYRSTAPANLFANVNDPESYRRMGSLEEPVPCIAQRKVQMVYRDGGVQPETLDVLQEHTFTVCLNGQPLLKQTCIAQHLEELVLGRLYTDGWISARSEAAQIVFTDDRAMVTLIGDVPQVPRQRTAPLEPIAWTNDQVFQLADAFGAGSPLHRRTWSTHSCFLAKDGDILFSCEDIGRHNALDKAIGFGLKQGIDLTRCMIFTSGRVPTDMARKAIQAGIPILCSKGAATDKSIALGKQYGLTMLCSLRRDSFRIL